MKHIKKYELFSFFKSYKKGDYILIKGEYLAYLIRFGGYKESVVENHDRGVIKSEPDQETYLYTIEFYDNTLLQIPKKGIARKLNKKEIEEFEFKKSTHQYNL